MPSGEGESETNRCSSEATGFIGEKVILTSARVAAYAARGDIVRINAEVGSSVKSNFGGTANDIGKNHCTHPSVEHNEKLHFAAKKRRTRTKK